MPHFGGQANVCPEIEKGRRMEDLSKRFLAAVAFFVVGFNFVGFGMIENGSNTRSNPVWGFVGGVMDLEVYVLKIFACVAAGAIGLFIVGKVVGIVVEALNGTREEREARRISYESNRREASSTKKSKTIGEQFPEPKPAASFSYEVPDSVRAIPEPKPIPRASTPEELKEKAIKQIMGRR